MPTATLDAPASAAGPALRISLWVAQVLICAFFSYAAVMKLFTPIPVLAAMWPWTGQLPAAFVRTMGFIDLCGGLGVLLPSLTRIKPRLAVTATIWSIVLQICAVVFHISRGEAIATPVNAVVIAFLVFIYWGRSRKAPIQPR